jgi:hypothetical protein
LVVAVVVASPCEHAVGVDAAGVDVGVVVGDAGDDAAADNYCSRQH